MPTMPTIGTPVEDDAARRKRLKIGPPQGPAVMGNLQGVGPESQFFVPPEPASAPAPVSAKRQKPLPVGAPAAAVKRRPASLWTNEELGQHIRAAQESTEVDTLRRKEYEAHAALEMGLKVEQDPAKRQALKAQYDKTVGALGSSRSAVMRQWQGIVAGKTAERNAQFQAGEREHAIKQVHQNAEVNIQSHIEGGHELEAATQIELLYQHGLIGSAERDKRIAELPAKIALSAAERKINTGGAGEAVKDLEAQDTKGWSNENVEAHRKLLDFAKGQLTDTQTKTYQASYEPLAKRNLKDNPTPVEALADSKAVTADIAGKMERGELNPHQAEELLNANRAIDERLATQAKRDATLATLNVKNKYEAMLVYLSGLLPGQRDAAASAFKDIVRKDADLPADEKLTLFSKADTLASKVDAIDRDAVNALTKEVEAFEQSHIGGPALSAKVTKMMVDGKFGTNNPHGNTVAQSLLKRIDKGEYNVNRGYIDLARKSMELNDKNPEDGDKLLMFNESMDAWVAAHPDAKPEEAWVFGKQEAARIKALEVRDVAPGWFSTPSPLTPDELKLKALREGKVPAPVAIPAVKDRVVGQTYTMPSGLKKIWREGGWEPIR